MKQSHRVITRVSSGALALATGLLVAGAGAGRAAETDSSAINDPHSVGTFTLLDSRDRPVTSGRTDVAFNTEVTHARAPMAAPKGYTDASQLTMWTPAAGADPSQWNGGPLGTSTPLTGAQKTQPMQAANVSNWSLDRDVILSSGPSKGSFANRYQLRLIAIESGPSVAPGYYTLQMSIDPAKHTWRVVGSADGTGSAAWVAPVAGLGGLVVLCAGVPLLRRRRRTHTAVKPAVPAVPVAS